MSTVEDWIHVRRLTQDPLVQFLPEVAFSAAPPVAVKSLIWLQLIKLTGWDFFIRSFPLTGIYILKQLKN